MRFDSREFKVLNRVRLYLSAGLPLSESLKKAGEEKLFEKVEKGLFFSDALKSEGFSEFIVHNIKVAEETGRLKEVVEEIVNVLDMQRKFLREMRSALILPSITLCFVLLLVLGTIRFLIPELAGLFLDLGIEIPSSMEILIRASDFVKGEFVSMISVISAVSIPVLPFFVNPFFIFRKAMISLTAKSLSLCIRNGIEIQKALFLVSKFLDREKDKNSIISDAVSIIQGKEPSFSFFGELSDELKRAYDVGELERVLEMVSKVYEEKARNEMEILKRSVEPALFLFTAVIVVIFVISVYAPLIKGLEKILE